MQYEEITQGQPEDGGPAGLGVLAWIAIAVVCLLAGVLFLVWRGPAEPAAAPTADPNPGPTGITLVADPPEKLGLGRICSVVSDGHRTLSVSFTLVNVSRIAVTLMDVEAVPPIGGLRPFGPNRAGGTCEHPGSEAPGGLLMPGATQLITMRFRLPKECRPPFPVPARVRLRVNQMVGTTSVTVYRNLGSITVDPCSEAA